MSAFDWLYERFIRKAVPLDTPGPTTPAQPTFNQKFQPYTLAPDQFMPVDEPEPTELDRLLERMRTDSAARQADLRALDERLRTQSEALPVQQGSNAPRSVEDALRRGLGWVEEKAFAPIKPVRKLLDEFGLAAEVFAAKDASPTELALRARLAELTGSFGPSRRTIADVSKGGAELVASQVASPGGVASMVLPLGRIPAAARGIGLLGKVGHVAAQAGRPVDALLAAVGAKNVGEAIAPAVPSVEERAALDTAGTPFELPSTGQRVAQGAMGALMALGGGFGAAVPVQRMAPPVTSPQAFGNAARMRRWVQENLGVQGTRPPKYANIATTTPRARGGYTKGQEPTTGVAPEVEITEIPLERKLLTGEVAPPPAGAGRGPAAPTVPPPPMPPEAPVTPPAPPPVFRIAPRGVAPGVVQPDLATILEPPSPPAGVGAPVAPVGAGSPVSTGVRPKPAPVPEAPEFGLGDVLAGKARPAAGEAAVVRPGEADLGPVNQKNPALGRYVEVDDPETLGLDPKRFQHKESDALGTTPALKGVKRWNPESPPIMVWEAEDGTRWVVDGHQRFNLYRRLKAEGQELPNLVINLKREVEGWPEVKVKRAAALQNLMEPTTDATDIAKLLRTGPLTAEERALIPKGSLAGKRVDVGEALAGLGDDAFTMAVLNKEISPEAGALVARHISDPEQQARAIVELKKRNLTNQSIADETRTLIGYFNKFKNAKGSHTRGALNDAATSMARGEIGHGDAAEAIIAAVRADIEGGGPPPSGAGAGRPAGVGELPELARREPGPPGVAAGEVAAAAPEPEAPAPTDLEGLLAGKTLEDMEAPPVAKGAEPAPAVEALPPESLEDLLDRNRVDLAAQQQAVRRAVEPIEEQMREAPVEEPPVAPVAPPAPKPAVPKGQVPWTDLEQGSFVAPPTKDFVAVRVNEGQGRILAPQLARAGFRFRAKWGQWFKNVNDDTRASVIAEAEDILGGGRRAEPPAPELAGVRGEPEAPAVKPAAAAEAVPEVGPPAAEALPEASPEEAQQILRDLNKAIEQSNAPAPEAFGLEAEKLPAPGKRELESQYGQRNIEDIFGEPEAPVEKPTKPGSLGELLGVPEGEAPALERGRATIPKPAEAPARAVAGEGPEVGGVGRIELEEPPPPRPKVAAAGAPPPPPPPPDNWSQLKPNEKAWLTQRAGLTKDAINAMPMEELRQHQAEMTEAFRVAKNAKVSTEPQVTAAGHVIGRERKPPPLEPQAQEYLDMIRAKQRTGELPDPANYPHFAADRVAVMSRAIERTRNLIAKTAQGVKETTAEGEELVRLLERPKEVEFTPKQIEEAIELSKQLDDFSVKYLRRAPERVSKNQAFPEPEGGIRPPRDVQEHLAQERAQWIEDGSPDALKKYSDSLSELQDREYAIQVRNHFTEEKAAPPKKGFWGEEVGAAAPGLFPGVRQFEKLRELYDKDPAKFYRLMRYVGRSAGAVAGGFVGEELDEKNPFAGFVMGALAGYGLTSRKLYTKYTYEVLGKYAKAMLPRDLSWKGLQGRPGGRAFEMIDGRPALRLMPNAEKDISALSLWRMGTLEHIAPDLHRRVWKIIDQFNQEAAHGRLANAPLKTQQFFHKLTYEEAAEAAYDMADEFKAKGLKNKATLARELADTLANKPTGGQRETQRILKGFGLDVNPDVIERVFGTQVYRVLIGWALDSGVANTTQPILGLRHYGVTDLFHGYVMARKPEGIARSAHLRVTRPVDVDVEPAMTITGRTAPSRLGRVVKDPGIVMATGDNFNRRVTYLSALHYAQKKLRLSASLADDWAQEVVRTSQGDVGPTGFNPMWRGPVLGTLRPFQKFPALFAENVFDMMFQPNKVTAGTTIVAIMGLDLLARKAFGLDLADMLLMGGRVMGIDPRHPMESIERLVTLQTTPAGRAVGDFMSHLAGTATHPFGPEAASLEDFLSSDVPYLFPGRFPTKAIQTGYRFAKYGTGKHMKRTASGAPDEVTAAEDLLNLFGIKTTRQTKQSRLMGDMISEIRREQVGQRYKRNEIERLYHQALDRGDKEGAARQLSRLRSTPSAEQMGRAAQVSRVDRLLRQASPETRSHLEQKYGKRLRELELPEK